MISTMLARPPTLVFHDELGLVNDPVAFLDFVAHASHHGLRFLAEAQFSSMPWERLPEAVRALLADFVDDSLRAQQFLDFLGNRRLRNSLLVRADAPPAREPDPAVVRDCALRLHMFPADGRIKVATGDNSTVVECEQGRVQGRIPDLTPGQMTARRHFTELRVAHGILRR